MAYMVIIAGVNHEHFFGFGIKSHWSHFVTTPKPCSISWWVPLKLPLLSAPKNDEKMS